MKAPAAGDKKDTNRQVKKLRFKDIVALIRLAHAGDRNTFSSPAPMNNTAFLLIFSLSTLPPNTAAPVHIACPMMPPMVVPNGSFLAASAMVAIWLRSPHSARN
jgi:hypothetical protein